jgi:hypothetical protein
MADQQPGDEQPAAGEPDATRAAAGEPSTTAAPTRWSGSAAVPQPGPKKSRSSRRAARLAREDTPDAPPAKPEEPDPTTADPYDWASMPPVDPWADQDTPWDAFPFAPEPPESLEPPEPPGPLGALGALEPLEPPLPPTRIDRPARTRIDGPPASAQSPAVPPNGGLPPAAPPNGGLPPAAPLNGGLPPVAPAPTGPPPVAQRPAPPAPPKKSRWGRKPKQAARTAQPINRVRRPATAIEQSRPLPPAPPWVQRPPQRPLPPPRRRRRRRWGRRFSLFGLFGLLCCCGVPLAYLNFPAARQYPVNAVLPDSFLDLNKRNDDNSKEAAARLAQELRDAGGKADATFAGIYGDGDGKRVTVFGVTGWRLDPGRDVRSELDRLSDEFGLEDVRSFPAGEFGVHEECGIGRSDGKAVVVCAWADHGSLATVLLTRRSLDESAQLVEQLRSTVLTPGIAKPSGGIPKL